MPDDERVYGVIDSIGTPAEDQLPESEERLGWLSEAAFEGISITVNGRIVDANERLAQMFGYDVAEVVGMQVLELTAPESRDLVSQNIKLQYDKPYEHLALRKDGSVFPVEVCGKPLPYRGRSARATAIRDITERKEAAEELQKAREELEIRVERQMQRGEAFGLSFRELTVLNLVADGKPDREIATALGISYRTVEKHVENVLKKMGVTTRTEASVRAIRGGLID